MSQLQIFGVPPSSYVRTARMATVEKGIEHELVVVPPPEMSERHPFSKVPASEHDGVRLYETRAVCSYIDAAFDGPALMPTDKVEQARAEQWISVLNCYAYDDLVRKYFFLHVFPKDGTKDQAAIDAGVPRVEKHLALLDVALEGRDWLAGDRLSLADLFWAPVVATVSHMPEAGKILDRSANVRRWLTAIESRDSAKFLLPPQS